MLRVAREARRNWKELKPHACKLDTLWAVEI